MKNIYGIIYTIQNEIISGVGVGTTAKRNLVAGGAGGDGGLNAESLQDYGAGFALEAKQRNAGGGRHEADLIWLEGGEGRHGRGVEVDIDVGCVLAGGGKLGKGNSLCVHGSSLSVDVRKDGLENGGNLNPIVVIDNHLLYNASIAQRNSRY